MKHNSENKTNKENDKDKDKINQAKIDRLKQILSQEKFLRNAADIDNLIVEYRNMNFIKYLMINYGYNYACKFFQTITLKEYNPNTVIYLIGINILYNKIKYQYKGDPNYFEYFVLYGQVANISTVKLDYFSKLLKDGTYFIASNLEGSLVGTNDINANERFRSSISTDCNKINENDKLLEEKSKLNTENSKLSKENSKLTSDIRQTKSENELYRYHTGHTSDFVGNRWI